jgi:hypothetical protein
MPNLVLNPGFEVDVSWWDAFVSAGAGTATGARSTVNARTGVGSFRVQKTLNDNSNGLLSRTVTGLQPGTLYPYSAWIKITAQSGAAQAYITVIGKGDSAKLTTVADWTLVTADFTATASSHQIYLAVDGTGTLDCYYDDVLLGYIDEAAVAWYAG